jgi:hypothetical protein
VRELCNAVSMKNADAAAVAAARQQLAPDL